MPSVSKQQSRTGIYRSSSFDVHDGAVFCGGSTYTTRAPVSPAPTNHNNNGGTTSGVAFGTSVNNKPFAPATAAPAAPSCGAPTNNPHGTGFGAVGLNFPTTQSGFPYGTTNPWTAPPTNPFHSNPFYSYGGGMESSNKNPSVSSFQFQSGITPEKSAPTKVATSSSWYHGTPTAATASTTTTYFCGQDDDVFMETEETGSFDGNDRPAVSSTAPSWSANHGVSSSWWAAQGAAHAAAEARAFFGTHGNTNPMPSPFVNPTFVFGNHNKGASVMKEEEGEEEMHLPKRFRR